MIQMDIDLSFLLVNGLTIIFLVSPLFLFVPYTIVICLLLFIPLLILFFYTYFSLPKSKSSINQFEQITIAHRGGRPLIPSTDQDDFPENTMSAYRWASKMPGVDGIELDIWLSKDHIPMVNHDGYLEHTFANCKEFLSALTCQQLKNLKYLKKSQTNTVEHYQYEQIPTLEEVIIFLEPTKLKLMIEIKESAKIFEMAKILSDLFKRYPYLYERAYCAAFHPLSVYSIRRLNPYITTAFLVVPNVTTYIVRNANQTPRPYSAISVKNILYRWLIDSLCMWFGTPMGLKFLGADLVCIEQRQISQNLLDQYKQTDIIVCAWCVNESEQRRWLKANGVTIITDTLFHIEQN